MSWNGFLAAGGLVIAVALCGCVTTPRSAPVENGRRFDRVERLVRTRYYDPNLRGLDWRELCASYRPQAVAATDDQAWYRAVNGMLLRLRDAHTRAERPRAGSEAFSRSVADPAAPPPEGGTSVELPDGTVVLRFDHFDDATVRWFARQVSRHRDAPGLIIDLRWNRGGWVKSNQRAVGLFFQDPVTIGIATHRSGRRVVERSRSVGSIRYDGPVGVLVGRNSHSSAEVFARVLQYYRRATIVGLPTAGEVLGARPYPLSDGGRLYVSVSDFTCCDGRRLEGEGVTPDVELIGMVGGYDVEDDPAIATVHRLLRGSRLPAGQLNGVAAVN